MSLQVQMSYPLGSIGFLLGKLIRILFFFAFIVAIFKKTSAMAGYSLVEMALFFLTFNIVDTAAQVFFRGIYNARRSVIEGDFDFYLIEPCPSLMRMLLGAVDFLDIATMIPVILLTAVVFAHLPPHLGFPRYGMYFLLILNGVAIAFALHVFVAGLAVLTQELENTIWVYRDLMFLGKFPSDIYAAGLQQVLTFLIPIAVMVTFPAKALLGILKWPWAIYSFALSIILTSLSLLFWRFCVRRYTSTSS